jgi:hypothetical protein
MTLFGRSGGYYLFWCSFVYLVVGLTCAVYYKAVQPEYVQMVWLSAMATPLLVPPVARYFDMEPVMFDLFKKNKMPKNVVPFPAPQAVPKVEPPKEPEKPATTYYRLGITNNGRVSFQMGYSEITMNAGGIDNMIKQLECFRDQILQYENDKEEE